MMKKKTSERTKPKTAIMTDPYERNANQLGFWIVVPSDENDPDDCGLLHPQTSLRLDFGYVLRVVLC